MYKRAVITEEIIDLTSDTLSAVILNQFLYWTVRVKDCQDYLEEVKQSREYVTSEQEEFIEELKAHGWIYKKIEELRDEIMFKDSVKTIRRRVKDLCEAGYLEERRNPYHRWDRVLQYRVNLVKIEADLRELGHSLATVMGEKYKIVKVALSGGSDDAMKGHGDARKDTVTFQPDVMAEQYQTLQTETTSEITNRPPQSAGEKKSISKYQELENSHQDFKSKDEEEREKDSFFDQTSSEMAKYSEPVRKKHNVREEVKENDGAIAEVGIGHRGFKDSDEENDFFQLALAWKLSEDKNLDQSRGSVIVQAIIDRVNKGNTRASDRFLMNRYLMGELGQTVETKVAQSKKRSIHGIDEDSWAYIFGEPMPD